MNEPLQPVWIAFPKIPWGSIGWRMGPGEDYWHSWVRWFTALTPSACEVYREQWPEPDGWKDFYRFVETGALPGWFEERQKLVAESAIPPRADENEIRDYHRVLWLIRQHFKRVRADKPTDSESIAEIYAAPDGSRWRLSAHMSQGGMRFNRLPPSFEG